MQTGETSNLMFDHSIHTAPSVFDARRFRMALAAPE
jgi:hypothetical protein